MAFYWVDGKTFNVDDKGSISTIFVENDTVYTGGISTITGSAQGCYWKGNVKTNLERSKKVTSLLVKDGNVFVAGTSQKFLSGVFPCYWVNKVCVDLPIPPTSCGDYTAAASIFIF